MCMYSCRCNVSSQEKELCLRAYVPLFVCPYVCPSVFRPAGTSCSMKQVNFFILDHFPIIHRNGAEPLERPIPYCVSASAFKSCICLIKCDPNILILSRVLAFLRGDLFSLPTLPLNPYCVSLGVWDMFACNVSNTNWRVNYIFFRVTYFLKCVYKPRQITWNLNYAQCSKEMYIWGRKGKEPEALLSLPSLTPILALALGCHCRAPYT